MQPGPEQNASDVHHQVTRTEEASGQQNLDDLVQDAVAHGDGQSRSVKKLPSSRSTEMPGPKPCQPCEERKMTEVLQVVRVIVDDLGKYPKAFRSVQQLQVFGLWNACQELQEDHVSNGHRPRSLERGPMNPKLQKSAHCIVEKRKALPR